MRDRWNDTAPCETGALAECVHGSRLLGSEPTLVLHGGGNTSVKTRERDVTGAEIDVLHVKGSGWDLDSIEVPGFAPLRLSRLRELLQVPELSDSTMMNEFRCALLDASAPDPSVEALLHAQLPFAAVQHSHADVIVTLTNCAAGAHGSRSPVRTSSVTTCWWCPTACPASTSRGWSRAPGRSSTGRACRAWCCATTDCSLSASRPARRTRGTSN
jgi:rhamnose utilization protein RhaD (predicted bifunctional aldolase and dehydrogenase)